MVLYGGGVCAIETGGDNESGCVRDGKVEACEFQTGQGSEENGGRVGAPGPLSLESGFTGRSGLAGIHLAMVHAVTATAGGNAGKLGGGHEGGEHSGPDQQQREVGGEPPHFKMLSRNDGYYLAGTLSWMRALRGTGTAGSSTAKLIRFADDLLARNDKAFFIAKHFETSDVRPALLPRRYNPTLPWHSPLERNSDLTKLFLRLARGGWARCIGRGIHGWGGMWR